MQNKRQEEFKRWFEQAKYDLKAAKDSSKNGNFEWSCFQAQQAGEKAFKAYLSLKGELEIFTHSIDRLLKKSIKKDKSFQDIIEVKELDQYYIPTRYPNGLPDAIPHKYYNEKDGEKCLRLARKIIKYVEKSTKI